MDEVAISADGISKSYGDVTAVRDLDLAVRRGSVYGFLGPNGAGKTTTIRILTTLLRPSSGSASVLGHSIRNRSAVVPNIGYLPETPPVHDELTGLEQVRYAADLRGVPASDAAERIDDLFERLDLHDASSDRIETYSKGMRRKVGLVQALVHDPAVVFLDEPTSGLDPRATRVVLDLIIELTADGSTVFLSSHDLTVVEETAGIVGVLHEGRLVAEGPPGKLRQSAGSDDSLEAAFLEVTEGAPGPE